MSYFLCFLLLPSLVLLLTVSSSVQHFVLLYVFTFVVSCYDFRIRTMFGWCIFLDGLCLTCDVYFITYSGVLHDLVILCVLYGCLIRGMNYLPSVGTWIHPTLPSPGLLVVSAVLLFCLVLWICLVVTFLGFSFLFFSFLFFFSFFIVMFVMCT